MLSKEELEQIGNVIDQKIAPLKQGQAHLTTVVEALAAGQHDIREHMATKDDIERLEKGQGEIKATIQDVDAKLVKRVNNHEKRIDELEKEVGIPNPHKN